ncbi:hypothetical protein BC832DRAFT_553121 [Gaertneriomyces semiglobifer]|nr:hypothetical protein BC832DRAFT_553121 [Gaertneriomyces semiglobifer]
MVFGSFNACTNDLLSIHVSLAAVLTIKIQAMLNHLRNPSNPHRKDISTKRRLEHIVSQRMKMLKYLRRTDLERFVKTCQAIGVEPDSIRV